MRFREISKFWSLVNRGTRELLTNRICIIFFRCKNRPLGAQISHLVIFWKIGPGWSKARRSHRLTDYSSEKFFRCKNYHFRDQICDLASFSKISLGYPEVPGPRYRQHQKRVDLGTTALVHSCGCVFTSPVGVGSDWYLGGVGRRTDMCQI